MTVLQLREREVFCRKESRVQGGVAWMLSEAEEEADGD